MGWKVLASQRGKQATRLTKAETVPAFLVRRRPVPPIQALPASPLVLKSILYISIHYVLENQVCAF